MSRIRNFKVGTRLGTEAKRSPHFENFLETSKCNSEKLVVFDFESYTLRRDFLDFGNFEVDYNFATWKK
jgi:hypothetical protein